MKAYREKYSTKPTKYIDWCMEDPDDERKINYSLEVQGEVFDFTSESNVSLSIMWALQASEIRNIGLIEGEWYADLYCDEKPPFGRCEVREV